MATVHRFPVREQTAGDPPQPARERRRRGFWAWFFFLLFLAAAGLGIAGEILIQRANPILRGRLIETLSTRFNSKVELDSLDVSLVKGLEVSGQGLRIFAPDDLVAAGATAPLIAVRRFSFHASLRGLFFKPTRVGTVYLTGLEIHIPPRQMRDRARAAGVPAGNRVGKMKISVDHFLCDQSALVIDNGNPQKEPKRFVLDRIELWEIGLNDPAGAPWRYDATLVNALPRGDIHATGAFGPWIDESPGDASVSGHYTFDHADLNSIKGIGGILSSVGDFHGQLNRIAVAGTTDTPDFSLDSAAHPMHLKTTFKAIVDGTSGDTYLDPVHALLRNTPIDCRGSVIDIRGQGHVIDLDVAIPNGHLEDLLALAVKTRPVYLTASIGTHARLHIRPGRESVTQKLAMKGAFTLRNMQFNNPAVQDKVDQLSLRAQGRPAEAKPGAPVTASQMTGNFALERGRFTFDKLDYTLPGAQVALTGLYSLDGEQFDFHGTVRTQAQVSEMVSSWWKQILLKPVDRFFRKNGAGTEIPIRISGTDNEPKLGLDFGRKEAPPNNK